MFIKTSQWSLHNKPEDAKISHITIEEASGAAAAVKKFMRTGGHQVKGKQVNKVLTDYLPDFEI